MTWDAGATGSRVAYDGECEEAVAGRMWEFAGTVIERRVDEPESGSSAGSQLWSPRFGLGGTRIGRKGATGGVKLPEAARTSYLGLRGLARFGNCRPDSGPR